MKKISIFLAAVIVFVLPALSFASTWQIDPDHSNIQFKVRHLMVSNVKGVFHKVSGMAEIDDQDMTRSRVSVTIETASVDTGVAKRDDDLRSANFFDVTRYPTMTFVSRKIVKTGTDSFKVTGDLSIHGVTREVVLDVDGPTAAVKDPWGGMRRGATATTKINRKDFGLTYNKVLETGG
ncbi:MAG TPA: YceI family protein, partial [Geobacteraceae bacterium]|nr:YceI family protein [Geobacteraceae bacterium]